MSAKPSRNPERGSSSAPEGDEWEPTDAWTSPSFDWSPPQGWVHRDLYETPGGASVIVRVVAEDGPPDDDGFDRVVRAAAGFLADFLPASRIVLTYFDSAVPAGLARPGEGSHVASLARSFAWRPDAGAKISRSWLRDVAVHLYPRAWAFLSRSGAGAGDGSGILPKELDHVLELSVFIADSLTQSLPAHPAPATREVHAAVVDSMPDRLLSYAAAIAALSEVEFLERDLDELAATLREVVRHMRDIATMRVEGEPQTHAVAVETTRAPGAERAAYPAAMGGLKRTYAMTNGRASVLVLDRRCGIRRIAATSDSTEGLTPERIAGLKAAVGIALYADSTIVLTVRGVPFASLRAGRWRALLGTQLERALEAELGAELGASLARLVFHHHRSGHGALICVTDDLSGVSETDVVAAAIGHDHAGPPQWTLHRALPTLEIARMPLRFLSTIVGIDGATIVDSRGRLLAYGAVVPVKNTGMEGARTSAARTLSERGLTLKVSADGPISVWRNGTCILEI